MTRFWLVVALLSAAALAPAETTRDRPLVRDLLGLNVHYKFRPKLYQPICRLIRNYHNLSWDFERPGDPITLPHCVNGIDWNRGAYGKWKSHGYENDLCLMFGPLGRGGKDYQKLWAGADDWTIEYGKRLAQYFGPSGDHKLVTSIEIGNEPGAEFDDALYQRIFRNLATGIRQGDPAVKIVTATAHARPADKYSKSLDETFSSPEIAALYDAINLHVYALKPRRPGQSPWDRSYPEDPGIDYLKIVDEAIAWRDRHAPDKEVWITEFGYDACTPKAMSQRTGWFEKLNWQGVSDRQQAQYLVRSVLCFTRRDVDRAYLYFYNDSDKPSVHAASGLTRRFEPKPAYWAVKHLGETLGDCRFTRAIAETDSLCVYEYRDSEDAGRTIWVAWSPTGTDQSRETTLRSTPGKLTSAVVMPTADGPARVTAAQEASSRAVRLTVTESPVYLEFRTRR